MASIEALIEKLRAAINSRDPSAIRSCITSALNAEQSGNIAPAQLAVLGSLIETAQGMSSPSADDTKVTGEETYPPPAGSLDAIISTHFTAREKAYYESFNPEGRYTVERYHHGKHIVKPDGTPETTEVSGKEIRDALVTTKYHSLDETQQKEIPTDAQPTQTQRQQLDKLSESLDLLESRRAFELHAAGKDKDVEKMSEGFTHAHAKVQAVIAIMDAMEAHKDAAPDMEGKLKRAQHDLKHSLQDDVLDDSKDFRKLSEANADKDHTAAPGTHEALHQAIATVKQTLVIANSKTLMKGTAEVPPLIVKHHLNDAKKIGAGIHHTDDDKVVKTTTHPLSDAKKIGAGIKHTDEHETTKTTTHPLSDAKKVGAGIKQADDKVAKTNTLDDAKKIGVGITTNDIPVYIPPKVKTDVSIKL